MHMGQMRKCFWKSGTEMLFPIMYGTMTYASHRCWQVYIKPMVWMCFERWRHRYGEQVRHQLVKNGGGEVLR